jgi:Fur family transcriptional regulator, iron response regulator
MTQKMDRKNKPMLSMDQIEARLVQAGVQPTLHRLAICQHVLCESDHPTAEEVHAWADKNLAKISLATVYNTLNTLVQAGILREFRFPHTDKIIFDTNLTHHYHFIDRASGQLYDVPMDQVEILPKLGRNYKIDEINVFLTGEVKPHPKRNTSTAKR